MNTVFDQSGAAGTLFKDSYITPLTVTPGSLFATPYTLYTHTERKDTPIRLIHCNSLAL